VIHRKKAVIVLSTVLIVCFAFFGLVAKFSLTAASENRKLEISSYEENIKTKESLLAKTYDKSDALQDEKQRTWREELVFMRAVVDGLNENNWEKRVQNKTRCLELELNEDNLITGVAEAQNELAFNKALMEYQAAPRDFAEDGVSSVYGLFKKLAVLPDPPVRHAFGFGPHLGRKGFGKRQTPDAEKKNAGRAVYA
jgi:hypothetical protein